MPEQKSAYDPFAAGQTGDYTPTPPQQEEGSKHSIFGRILGLKHAENLRQEHNKAKFIMEQLHDVATNPNNQMPDETVDWLVQQAGSVLGKDMGGAIKQHFEQVRAKKDLEQRQAMLPGHQPAQQAQPQAQAQAPTGTPQQPPGLPQPPSEAGGPAGAAPAQPNPAPAMMAKGSALGGAGFNVPPPANVPAPSGGSMFRRGATQLGVDTAARNGPQLQQEADIKTNAEVDLLKKQWAARRELYQGDPSFATLSPRQKTQAMAGQPITPETVRMIPGAGISDEHDIGLDGRPIGQGKLGTRTMVGDQLLFIPGRAESQGVLTTTDQAGTTTANQFGRFTGNRPGGGTINGVHGYNPAFAPTVSNVSTEREVVLPSGDIETLHGNTQRRTSRMGVPLATGSFPAPPTAAAPPAGAPATPTPTTPAPAPAAPYGHAMRNGRRVDMLPPRVRMDMELMGGPEGAINKTLEIVQGLHDDIGILSNPAVAKAIMMQADTRTGDIMTYLSGRYLQTLDPATKAKAETMAARVQGAMEHINTMRAALKATGFRGEDAFAAMIAQAGAGRLLQNPEVLRHTLETTLSTLRGQQGIMQATLRGGKPGAATVAPPTKKEIAPPGGIEEPPEKLYTFQSGGKTLRKSIPKADQAEFLKAHPEAKAQ